MTRTGRSGRLSLFLVGVAIAVGAEMTLGLLVHTGPGLLRAITVIVAVQLGALSTGLSTRPLVPARPGRWRWFLAVGAYLIAGTAALSWSFEVDLLESWATRGGSLALLAALPMYGAGVAVGAVPDDGLGGRGAPVLFGATAGVLLMGGVLFQRLEPLGVYLVGVLCLAMAALRTGLAALATRTVEEAGVAAVERETVPDIAVEDPIPAAAVPRDAVPDGAEEDATPAAGDPPATEGTPRPPAAGESP